MRRLFVILPSILFITVLLGLSLVWVALADSGPHGNYLAITDACAACHRAHTGTGARLLTSLGPGNEFCYTCHNCTGVQELRSIVSTHSNVSYTQHTQSLFTL